MDTDGNNTIDFKDFLIACVNFSDEDSFMSYMVNAYDTFFDNEFESVDTQDMIDQFCSEKDIDNKFVKEVMKMIDEDNSNTITCFELIESVVTNLNMDLPKPCCVIEELKYTYGKQINQSGSFVDYKFVEGYKDKDGNKVRPQVIYIGKNRAYMHKSQLEAMDKA